MNSKKISTVGATTLTRGTIARYAVGSFGTGGFSTLPGLVLVYYLTDNLGVTALFAGVIVTVAKVWDIVIDPMIGGLSDRALARTGSRRGPMMLGVIGLPLAFVLTFAAPEGLTPVVAGLWVFIAYVAAETFFSLFQVPYTSLPAELTDGYHERTRLLTWRVVVLTIAILLFGAGGPAIRGMFRDNPSLGYLVMGIVSAALIGLGLWIATSVVPRGNPAPTSLDQYPAFSLAHYRDGIQALRESPAFRALLGTGILQAIAVGLMLAAGQFVATWVLHKENAVMPLFLALVAPAVLFAPVWQLIALRIGKERAFSLASIVYLVATILLVGLLWAPGWWMLAPLALAGAAYAGLQSLPFAMLPDVISHEAASTDSAKGRAGIFGGVWTAGETAGLAFGSTLLTIVLACTGYIESAGTATVEQPASAVTGIVVTFSLLPAVLMGLSLITLKRYRLRESDLATSTTGAHVAHPEA
ncbi:MAG: MFS transporter [Microbacterium sp.]